MKRKHIIPIIIVLIAALIILRLVANKSTLNSQNRTSQDTSIRIPVKVAKAEEQLAEVNLLKTGSVEPFKEAKVFSNTGGIIQRLRFNLGDHVTEGQVLAVMDTRLLQLDIQKAESSEIRYRHDLQTYTDLLQGQAATQEKVDEVRQDYLDAENQVSQYRKQLADASIKAPTSGIISDKPVEQGVFVTAGTQIATIINLSKAKVQLNLTEAEVYQVKQGQPVKITTDVYPNEVFNGKISYISPQADETHNYSTEILAENKEGSLLRSGTFIYADFSRKTQQRILLIPRDAVTQSVKDAVVYVVENNVAHQKSIQTGPEMNDMIQVTKGLSPGDVVITSGQINLNEGSKVIISK